MSDYQPIEDDGEVTPPAQKTPEPIVDDRGEVQAKAPKAKSNAKKWIALGVAVVGILLIAGLIMFLLSQLQGNEEIEAEPDPTLQRAGQAQPSLGGYQQQLNEAQRRAEEARLAREREEEAARLRAEEAQRVADRAVRSSQQTAPPIRAQANNTNQSEPDPNAPSARRLEGDVVIGGGSAGLGSNGGGGSLLGGDGQGDSRIGDMLAGETYEPGSASIMQNMDMLLRRGTVIPCVLQNRVVSTYPSLSSCVITQDVYSADGSTVLAERGSVAYGEQKVALTQGQARLFMNWNEIDTAGGVRVRIDSLATDNLGASGVDAYIDNHFWDRFGGAIMLSFIDDGLEVLANRLSDQRQEIGTSFNSSTNNVQSMAEIALEQSINIPPTGYVNQGTLLNIRVARDVDFSSVYNVRGR